MPLCGLLKLIARSAASAPHALRHRLRSGPAPFRHRFVSAPLRSGPVSASSAGALTARSLHCAEPLLRRSLCAAGLRTSARPESQPSSFPASLSVGSCHRSDCGVLPLPVSVTFCYFLNSGHSSVTRPRPCDGDEKVAPLLVGSSLTPSLAVTNFRGAECHHFVFYLYFQHKSAII